MQTDLNCQDDHGPTTKSWRSTQRRSQESLGQTNDSPAHAQATPSPAQAALQANDNDNILVNMFRALELKLEMAESLRKS